MTSVTAVVTAHGRNSQVIELVGQLQRQTCPPEQILVYASDVPMSVLRELDVPTALVPNRNDWGHEKRSQGLADATGEWVGFFNDDDRYDPTYLEHMTAAADGHDLVMCRWDEKGRVISPKPHVGACTAGNFLARTQVARAHGWNDRHYEADGTFVSGLVAAGATWTVVDRVLYWHR